MPKPISIVSALPATTPFVGPEALQRRSGRLFALRLGANESLFGASPVAIAAMQAAAATGNFYCDPEGYELRTEIASRFGVSAANVTLGAGIDDLLLLFARAFMAPGESAVTSLGGYPTFEYVIGGCGGQIERVLYRDDRVDLLALGDKAREVKAKLVYLANPDNPSGSWQSAEEVQAFRAALPEDALLILDEAYSDFVPVDELPSVAVEDPTVVRLRTFSKGHAMAGLRVGYALAAREHITTLEKIRLHFAVNSVAQAGAIASLRDPGFLAEVVRQTDIGRGTLVEGAKAMGVSSLPSRTNFVCLDFETRARAEAVLATLGERGVFVRKPGREPLDRCVRVTIGRAEDVAAFLKELAQVIQPN
jgi:histidinol-phosphate aminotransferase